MKARILDKSWNIVFVDQSKLDPDNDAECDNPDTPGRQIRIHEDLRGELLLDTLVHESFHAAAFNLTEPFVERAATDIASILWRPAVLRRILDDPLAKKISLELIHADLAGQDKKPSAAARKGIREDAAREADNSEAVQDAPGSSDCMAQG